MVHNSVPLGRVYSRLSLSVWLLAVVRLAFTYKIRLTGRETLICLCWLLFQKLTAVKQAKLGASKNFLRLCISKACMLRYCALSRSLAKIRLQDTSLPHFSKTLRSLCVTLSWKAVVKWPIGYGVGLRIKRSSLRIRPWPLRWVLRQGSLLPLSQGEPFIDWLIIFKDCPIGTQSWSRCSPGKNDEHRTEQI